MAAFGDVGAHCTVSECRQRDFLPFKCELCKDVFCLQHRTPDSHVCLSRISEPEVVICQVCQHAMRVGPSSSKDATILQHEKSTCRGPQPIAACPVDGCRSKLTQSGSVICGICRVRVCLRHRYEETHTCASFRSRRPDLKQLTPGKTWLCTNCKVMNESAVRVCSSCKTERPYETDNNRAKKACALM